MKALAASKQDIFKLKNEEKCPLIHINFMAHLHQKLLNIPHNI
jgi:hypothetical protein